MKKRIWLFPLLILASLLLTGCALQTVDEMYALPKRSKEYDSLQSAIDSAMYGLSYSAPVSGKTSRRCRWQIWTATAWRNISSLPRETLPTLCRC